MDIKPQMKDVPPLEQASKAITHTLRNIAERPAVAWYLGLGTQTYALLVEALATIHSQPIQVIRENWPPAPQRKFKGDELNQCPFCGGTYLGTEERQGSYYVTCLDCYGAGPCGDTRAEARAKWNERTMPR